MTSTISKYTHESESVEVENGIKKELERLESILGTSSNVPTLKDVFKMCEDQGLEIYVGQIEGNWTLRVIDSREDYAIVLADDDHILLGPIEASVFIHPYGSNIKYNIS